MARTNLYALYDKEAQTVVGPVVAEIRHAPATRMFYELLADKQTLPGKYVEQFELRFVGVLDTETAVITPLPVPEVVASGLEWLAAQRRAALNPELASAQ